MLTASLVLGPLPTGFVFDKRSEGWELIHNQVVGVYPATLEVVDILRPEDKGFIYRDDFLGRAAALGGGVGQHFAEAILASASILTEDLRQYYLVFTETRWKGPDGRIYLVYLAWDKEKRCWTINFHWPEWIGWLGKARLVRLATPPK